MRSPSIRGFTLIEAVVATGLMVTIVATVAHLVLVAADQSAAARRDMQAIVLAQSKLEELRASPGIPVSGDDSVAGLERRWMVTPVDAGAPVALSLRVCIDATSVCVATVRVIRP